MDLFLETPQQQAERMLRQQQRLMEMQMQGVAAQPPAQNAAPAVSPAGGSAPENYSVQQDSYAQELAFDKRRTRHRRVGQRLRTLAMIVLIPLGLAAIFWSRMRSPASSTVPRPAKCSNICQPSASA